MNIIDKFKRKAKIIAKIIVVKERPIYLKRVDFLDIKSGDVIARYTRTIPYSKDGVCRLNGYSKVIKNDIENQILQLETFGRYQHEIHYSSGSHWSMKEDGMQVRGSASFECYFEEYYAKCDVSDTIW